jgi:thiamine-monophosphate kinase
VIDRARIPLSPETRQLVGANPELWNSIYAGGDDYQVLCTVSKEASASFVSECASVNVLATHIGGVKATEIGTVTLDIDGTRVSIEEDSFAHF